MNDLITRLAQEADLGEYLMHGWQCHAPHSTPPATRLERFAALVTEECAFMCDQMFNRAATADECADAIRAKFGSKG